MPHSGLQDRHGRTIDYIRLSLTDRCNFRCLYCMPPEGESFVPHGEVLSYEEILRVCRIAAGLGVSRYKITGGEPFCRKGSIDFIRRLRALPGVEQTTITTNGSLLGAHVEALADMGVEGVTVSLDSLSQDSFSAITRSEARLDDIVRAMAEARGRGLRVKINVVPLSGRNEAELPNLVRFALANGYHIRFIELMPVGNGRRHAGPPPEAIRDMIERNFGVLIPVKRALGNGPAECYSVAGHRATVGFISALSKKFCGACNRIRLTSLGYLKTCLHHNVGVDLKPLLRGQATDAELKRALVEAVSKKPKGHEFSREPVRGEPENFSMNSVGG